ncbi:hypothetical protein [Pseudomonas syringae]|uniref:hypothetical protein n=1 Tax=Pseudomonas syringae TaxID=317 RepID=UPI003F74F7E7
MNEITLSQITTFVLTMTGGVVIFVISQVILKTVIEPAQQLRAAIGETSNTLLANRGKITNAVTDTELSAAVRKHAAELMSKSAVLSWYSMARFLFGLPTKANIKNAARELNLIGYGTLGVSESARFKESSAMALSKSVGKIEILLGVPTSYE